MSVVVAIKDKGNVYVGCDSQVTSGGTRFTLNNPNNYKIWRVRNVDHCLMGHVGYVRDANVVRVIEDLVREIDAYKSQVDYDYVVNRIVPYIIDVLRERGYIKDDKYLDSMNSSFLFAYKDKLFTIHHDGSVIEIDDCVAIGSGADQAIGSLLSTDDETPEARIIKAIKATAASDIYVDYPIILTNTRKTDFQIIKESEEKKYLTTKETKKHD